LSFDDYQMLRGFLDVPFTLYTTGTFLYRAQGCRAKKTERPSVYSCKICGRTKCSDGITSQQVDKLPKLSMTDASVSNDACGWAVVVGKSQRKATETGRIARLEEDEKKCLSLTIRTSQQAQEKEEVS